MNATISILGLYNYDKTIFDDLEPPTGLDKSILIDYILMECADLEMLYPNWIIMKSLIASWNNARFHSWERLYQSTIQNYNMIHNYDRYEEWQDTTSISTSGQESTTDSRNASGNSNITDTTSTNSSGSTETSKASYNESTLTPTERVGSSADTTISGTGGSTTSSTESGSGSRTNSGSEDGESMHNGHLYGNIGITTAAKMLTEERALYKWDVYQAIAQEFKERFCILVY